MIAKNQLNLLPKSSKYLNRLSNIKEFEINNKKQTDKFQ